jgi:hypothetical protein
MVTGGSFPRRAEETGTRRTASGRIIIAQMSSRARSDLGQAKVRIDTDPGTLRRLTNLSGIGFEMIALVEITDGSSPLMFSKTTGFGGVSVYESVVTALAHAEPENTSANDWILFDEYGTFFMIVPAGKWFDLKPIKSDPVLALQLLMDTLRGT